jgi:isoleucyl-tRNA synthetase
MYKEFKKLDLPQIEKEILNYWKANQVFQQSIDSRANATAYHFYEGPPSANGQPGIHHVMARAIKDIFCRYKTLKGFKVERKGGWDTHGLPIELAVEKSLGITKEDIGKSITIEDYNAHCRKEVMKYTDLWNDLTEKMGYWVDLDNPYITYENSYIETLWYLLKELHKKNLLYKGYTIQPYSPAAGTGLSSHELNQPGTYKNVKDSTIVAQFELVKNHPLLNDIEGDVFALAWTTTPWTLPSNTALAVGEKIEYQFIQTFNPYTSMPITVVLAKDLVGKYFNPENAELSFTDYKAGDKKIPFKVLKSVKGKELKEIAYQQLLPFVQPEGDAFKIVIGDFVTTEDGTGIVHIAPSFGADDFRVAQQNGIGALTLVDKRGKFVEEVKDGVFLYGNEFVKEAYLSDAEKESAFQQQKEALKNHIADLKSYLSVDERIGLKLKLENKAFKIEKYEHSYPHCWRTDKPILYYPLDSWFIKTTAVKDRLVELNKTINWKPESTGSGRFGNWLENLVDWNLSRSRYWGTPLPIWRSEDGTVEKCIGSIEELSKEVKKSIEKGFLKASEFDFDAQGMLKTDLHRPYVDHIVLAGDNGEKLVRESDLIDVWFDSGAMPYAQAHFPFDASKHNGKLPLAFPADFIAEGVDQTRGWFFTLHAIAVLLFDQVAFKNVVSNGLVLDKNGNKMSKRLGNAVDPFSTIAEYGADATRWYLISNAAPWENLKFNIEGLDEVRRKFFGTLYNTYSFFALYANIDAFKYDEKNRIPNAQRAQIDQWILAKLALLQQEVEESFENFEPHKAARAIEDFVDIHLSNWYVRLSRRRFWKSELAEDKLAAYQTLFECLSSVAQLMSPIAPFFSDWLYQNLSQSSNSVHISHWKKDPIQEQNRSLIMAMDLAQDISSLILSIRKKVDIKVRQPLSKAIVPLFKAEQQQAIQMVEELIKSETNIKELQLVDDASDTIVKKAKANFKVLGKKVGGLMKDVAARIQDFNQEEIRSFESSGTFNITMNGTNIELSLEDVEIFTEDIPGWQVASLGPLTVALDIHIDEALKMEGDAREFINRIQNLRKERQLEVTDRIKIIVEHQSELEKAIQKHRQYICSEVLADEILIEHKVESTTHIEILDKVLKALIIKN